ncbi:MAG: GNAT family N-acetyltransferase [Sedimentisphaerales bacterium]
MTVLRLHDKNTIESFLRRNTYLHIYSIGDLDDFFWPYTTWYGLKNSTDWQAIALLYIGNGLPTLIALSEHFSATESLLKSIKPLLPEKFYAHFSPGLEEIFRNTHKIKPHGEHYKMALRELSVIHQIDCTQVVCLTHADLKDILKLYEESYPENWFNPRMLETGQYFGLRRQGNLVSIAGVHVYSAEYKVAALGNIATHPAHRNKGYSRLVTARLCQSLSATTDHIGLNVKIDNTAALSCYKKLGFQIIVTYGEFMLERR